MWLMYSCMAETTGPALGGLQSFGFKPFNAFVAGHYQLGHTLSVFYGECLVGKVYENYFHLAPVVAVDSAGGIGYGNAMLCCEAAAGAYLGFISMRQLYK